MNEMPRKIDEVVMAIFKIYLNLYFYVIRKTYWTIRSTEFFVSLTGMKGYLYFQ